MFSVLSKVLVKIVASSRLISGAASSVRSKALVNTALAIEGSMLELWRMAMYISLDLVVVRDVARARRARLSERTP